MIGRLLTGLMASLLCAAPLFAATIQGTVTNTATNQPIVGARVVLASTMQSGGTAVRDSLISDNSGAFVFSAVAQGSYTLSASATGFTARQPQQFFVMTADSLTRTIRLTPEGVVQPQSFGTIASIVTDSLSGKAIANAKVIVTRQGTRIDSALTNAQGSASFDSLGINQNYRLSISAEGYVTKSVSGITVRADSTTTVSAALALKPQPQGIIEGTIIDDVSEDSLAEVMVYLRLDTLINGTGWKIIDSVLTNAKGGYRFSGLEPSTLQLPYSLRAVKAGYRPATSTTIVLGATQTVQIPFALTPIIPTTLSVTVTDETTDSALSGVTVSIVNANATSYSAITTADGVALFSALDAGTYSITATLEGYMIASASMRVLAETPNTVSLTLEPTAEDSKTLSGTIRDNKGAVVASAVVTVNLERTNRPVVVLTATTGSDGRYSLSGIDALYTRASITAQKEGLNTVATSVTLNAAETVVDLVLETTVSAAALASSTPGAVQVQRLGSSGLLTLQISNAPAGAMLKAFTVNGRQALSQRLQAGCTTLTLAANAAASGSPLVVVIEHAGQTFYKQLLVH